MEIVMRLSLMTDSLQRAACKQYEWDSKNEKLLETPYPRSQYFYYNELEYNSTEEFFELLEGLQDENHFLIRGKLKEGVDTRQPILRRKNDREDKGEKATFEEDVNGVPWCMLDLDNIPNVWGDEPTTKDECRELVGKVVQKHLPPEFHNVLGWFQWSNSMYIKTNGWDVLKLHLFFHHDTPKTDTFMRQWAETDTDIDESPFRTVQPNYIAKPRFVNIIDPLSDIRSGLIFHDKTDSEFVGINYTQVDESTFRELSEKRIKQIQAVWESEGRKYTHIDLDKNPSYPMRRIAEIGVNGRLHMPITKSAGSWVASCGANPDRETWKRLVRERIALSGHPESKHRASDFYLNSQWDSAISRFKPNDPTRPPVPLELLVNPNQF